MLQVGILGGGLIGWTHAICLQAMIDEGAVDARIAAVFDTDSKRAEDLAAATGAAAVSSGATGVAERCDAVFVCTPTAFHAEAVEAAVTFGRAVFCEKPLSTSLAAAESLASLVEESGVPCQVGLVLRSSPVFRALRELVSSRRLGALMAAVMRDDQYFPVQGLYASTWRADSGIAGGGCLLEHSIHDVDILQYCLGEVAEVAATTASISGRGDVEDVATVSLRLASGASANLTSIWHEVLSRGSTRRLEVFGTDGIAWLDDELRGPLYVQTSEDLETVDAPFPAWVDELPIAKDVHGLAIRSYAEADRAFLEAVATGRTPSPGFDQALRAHRLVDAAYRSAALGGKPVAPA